MSRHWLAWPDWTDFRCRVIANREDEIQFGRTRLCELVPVLATQAFGGQFRNFELSKSFGVDPSLCMTSCAIRREGRKSLLVHYGFGHDGTSRYTSTSNVLSPRKVKLGSHSACPETRRI